MKRKLYLLPVVSLLFCALFFTACGKETPSAPELSLANINVNDNNITVVGLENVEYSNNAGENWQNSNQFTNLTYGKCYSIAVRYKETEQYLYGPMSNIVKITIPKKNVVTPILNESDVTVRDDVISVRNYENALYSFDNGVSYSEQRDFRGSYGSTYVIKVMYKETAIANASAPSQGLSITLKKVNTERPILCLDDIRVGAGEISVYGQPKGIEYSCDGGASWQTSETFKGLIYGQSYFVCIRVAATETSFASQKSTVYEIFMV